MKQSGFTLVEMAVVLVIIGLIASAVVAGKEVVEASRTRGIMAEIRDNMQSFEQFTDTYRAYPGDFTKASEVFVDGIAAAVVDAQVLVPSITAAAFNGNGDNRVTWEAPEGGGSSQTTGEGALAWLHLKLAGLGKYKNLLGVVQNGTAVLGSNVPASGIDNFGYYINYDDGILDQNDKHTIQNHMGLGRQVSGQINNAVSLSPQRTEAIDKKMDDGRPRLGIVQSIGAGCISGDAYNFANDVARETVSCLPLVRLN